MHAESRETLTIPFTKIEGAQNDFIVVDNLSRWYPRDRMKPFARAACHRRKGIGADGVIFLEPHASLDFTMLFFNPDGSDGSMCGNGGRCAVLFAHTRGIAPDSMRFEVLGQTYAAKRHASAIRLDFPPPRLLRCNVILRFPDREIRAHYAHVGAPHLVIFSEELGESMATDVASLDVNRWGGMIRRYPEFQPEGVNVNFLEIATDGLVHIRTFEKGVEAETEACGTGNLASAIIAAMVRGISPPITLRTHGGDTLTAGFETAGGEVRNPYLEGPAREVFSGTVRYDPATERLDSPEGVDS